MSAISSAPPGLLFAATATVANSVAETSLIGAGVGSLVLSPNFFVPGRSFKFYASGVHSATANPTLRHRVYLNGVVLLDSTAVASQSGTNNAWEARGFATCRTAGPAGTLFAQGFYEEDNSTGSPFGMVNAAAFALDTTVAQALTYTAQWGVASASNSLSCTNFLLEAIN